MCPDAPIQEVLAEYKAYIKKLLRPKRVSGLVLNNEDSSCPTVPDPRKQKHYQSFLAKLQCAAS
jgi:hypothetical protein